MNRTARIAALALTAVSVVGGMGIADAAPEHAKGNGPGFKVTGDFTYDQLNRPQIEWSVEMNAHASHLARDAKGQVSMISSQGRTIDFAVDAWERLDDGAICFEGLQTDGSNTTKTRRVIIVRDGETPEIRTAQYSESDAPAEDPTDCNEAKVKYEDRRGMAPITSGTMKFHEGGIR